MIIKTEIKIPKLKFHFWELLPGKLSYPNSRLSKSFHIIIISKKRQTWQAVSRFTLNIRHFFKKCSTFSCATYYKKSCIPRVISLDN